MRKCCICSHLVSDYCGSGSSWPHSAQLLLGRRERCAAIRNQGRCGASFLASREVHKLTSMRAVSGGGRPVIAEHRGAIIVRRRCAQLAPLIPAVAAEVLALPRRIIVIRITGGEIENQAAYLCKPTRLFTDKPRVLPGVW